MEEHHFSHSKLHLVSEAALTYLDLDDLLNELLERITEILDADTAAILLVDDDGETLAARAAKGLEDEVERGFRLPIGAGFAGRVAQTREPVVIKDLDSSPIEVVNPVFRERGVRSLLGVPLVVERDLVGVLHVGTLRQRSFDEEDVGLLRLVGDRAALAIEHAKLIDERRVSQVLQRSLLPKRLPEIPGLDLAARYHPAAAGARGGRGLVRRDRSRRWLGGASDWRRSREGNRRSRRDGRATQLSASLRNRGSAARHRRFQARSIPRGRTGRKDGDPGLRQG
jgi:GAF domain-containing protein